MLVGLVGTPGVQRQCGLGKKLFNDQRALFDRGAPSHYHRTRSPVAGKRAELHIRAREATKRRRKEYVNTTRVLLLPQWFLVPLVLVAKVQRFNGPRRLGSNLLQTKEPKDQGRKDQRGKGND